MFVLLVLVVFLYAFSSAKNSKRIVSEPEIQFLGDNNLFITHANVSKLLIQSQQIASNAPKEILDLNKMESALNSNPMIKSAEVYVSVNGELKAEVEQKNPIARISTNTSYYLDDEGGYMPLSTNHAARVPLVTGFVDKNALENIYKIAKKVDEDSFLKKYVIQINQSKDSTIQLKLRQSTFIVHLGDLKQLEKKINNLKVFYQKALKEKTLNDYSKVNLQFDNQVVCTKT
ncbi:cell division protein FtsQ/DivIB [Oceanihabitans sediminis]|uniref:cell division protein FtsQ/DivIB n=1 Tax=Oceanihabitans sediminis TaxID=1812012 RepID=UPI00299EC4C5|nr:cell division protein FtsQ/DivIB [Oceanihabitans sediminis]MDX1773909.1 cell division protein FtsQ/DivIB [Oceanihabitans sediminis]